MIIQVCGHLIDTQYIYEITKVETTFYQVGWDNHDRYAVTGRFKINFINKKDILITKEGNYSHKTMHTTEYKAEESIVLKQLNDVRDQLIYKWKTNQLSIPKIEFNESTSIT